MQVLRRLDVGPETSWYALRGDRKTALERYVVSTAPSRDICNQPEILGVAYTEALYRAMVLALETAPFRPLIEDNPQDRTCVIHFLRGGLNFGLRRALHAAYGFNCHSSAFLSSQRAHVDGRWQVREDMYRKLEIPADAVLVMGDVVATGVTMENGLMVIAQHALAIGASLRALVFFTIGCKRAEEILEGLDRELRSLFPGYLSTVLVYLEGRFRLVDAASRLRIGIPGTDLVRFDTPLSPEFELSQADHPAYALERCVIYDAGSRSFDIPSYIDDVRGYWRSVRDYAREGWTLSEALEERWPGHGTVAGKTLSMSATALEELAAAREEAMERAGRCRKEAP
jgi:hypothetical protein